MELITSASEARQALLALRECLTRLLGRPVAKHRWTFPGGAGGGDFRTWFCPDVLGGPLAIGIGAENDWNNRTPVLLARVELERGITPTVEINIPSTDGAPDRRIAGLFYRGTDGRPVLAHRGSRFTASGTVIRKEDIHNHFASWMVSIDEGDGVDSSHSVNVIPVSPVADFAVSQLAAFADHVLLLKERSKSTKGEPPPAGKRTIRGAWRSELRFPDKLSRIVTASLASFEYRHGPIQAALWRALEVDTSSQLTIALNQRVDVALLRGKKVAAIFEVKTDLGPQLYAGIGQLFLYRQQFAERSTPLFLVIPRCCRTDAELRYAGEALRSMGIVLLTEENGELQSWNGTSLLKTMREAGLPTRGARP